VETVIRVDAASKHFLKGDKRIVALDDVRLDIQKGSFVVLLGRSGCGKSTLLNMVAGLSAPTSGAIYYRDSVLLRPHRNISYMTQKDTLMPWRNLRSNVGLPLEVAGMDRAKRNAMVDDLIDRVGLSGFAGHYPRELSGGMLRRASMARMLSTDPETLLLDEPFGALDAQLRRDLQAELLRLWQGSGRTVVFVTHDLDEALILGDRVVVLGRAGEIVLDHSVGVARPRDPDDVGNDPKFLEERKLLTKTLREAGRR
jgi:NitT/TauT family transport system ATP-binding protein